MSVTRRSRSLTATAVGCALALSLAAAPACGAGKNDARTGGDPAPEQSRQSASSRQADSSRAAQPAKVPTREASGSPSASNFGLKTAVSGLSSPIWVGAAPGDKQGLWVAQQNGRLVRIANGKRTVRLSVASQTRASGEQGLLGVAFLPDYARSKRVVIHYTARSSGDTRVELWRLGSEAQRMAVLLRVRQPAANHNGGQLVFGDSNRLYLGLGDGGGGDDPGRTAQNMRSRLGKILVATVTRNSKTPRWRVAAYGVRNPWRFWFDSQEKELWIADVGQNAIEEINRIKATGRAPNLGWSTYEGRRRNGNGDTRLRGEGPVVWPVVQYSHDHGCSVTGGEIYRGSRIAELRGRYVFGDFCSGAMWSARPTAVGGVEDVRQEAAEVSQLTSFGTGPDGELYATSLSGRVVRLVAN